MNSRSVKCPFCFPSSTRVFYESEVVVGLWDHYPVSSGHALLVPRRHVPDWFQASEEERRELMVGVQAARDAILENHQPQGFNLGINMGEAAGQTVFHLHVHLIPRYSGDVDDPRGGIRCLIPGKARYWEASD